MWCIDNLGKYNHRVNNMQIAENLWTFYLETLNPHQECHRQYTQISLLYFVHIWMDFGRAPNGPLARYVKLRVAHAPGMLGTFSPPPRVSDPDMHHGTCVAHVPCCMPGSLTTGFLWIRWRGKRSRHSRSMHNPQFDISVAINWQASAVFDMFASRLNCRMKINGNAMQFNQYLAKNVRWKYVWIGNQNIRYKDVK